MITPDFFYNYICGDLKKTLGYYPYTTVITKE